MPEDKYDSFLCAVGPQLLCSVLPRPPHSSMAPRDVTQLHPTFPPPSAWGPHVSWLWPVSFWAWTLLLGFTLLGVHRLALGYTA